jgi:enoyl-[acyl-carrier protein] reductase I
MYSKFAEVAPLREGITIEDVGNSAVYLCSDLAAKTTGEVVYVDSGYNILGITEVVDT